MALTDKLSNIADAIRTKTDTTGKMTLTEMPDKILGIQTSEDLDTELTEQQQLISELKTTLETKAAGVTINNQDKTITENGTYTADEGYTGLGTVTVEVAPPPSDIDALIDGSITEVSSNVTKVGSYAFYECKSLVSADIPSAQSIGAYAFYFCSKLPSINCPKVTSIGQQAFSNTKIKSADFPLVTSIGANAFAANSELESVNFPLLSIINSSSFSSCAKLTNVTFPSATAIYNNAFSGDAKLVSADFLLVTRIQTYVFQSCCSLTRVILRSLTMCVLNNTNAFNYCYHIHGTTDSTFNPNGLKDGYIYVPRDLVESYKSATNWSNFATQFRALEDYTVDGTTTGALDESKI
jgi:hypothetical protein